MKELTVKEAIDQGYTHYGIDGMEWQQAEDLHDDVFEEVDEDQRDNLVLFSKESGCPEISKETIGEVLSDYIGDQDSNECQREDDQIYKAVKEIDFKSAEEAINKVLEEFRYWMLTDIKLVK